MSLSTNTPYNSRLLKDANFVSAVSTSVNLTTGFDLVQAVPYPVVEVTPLNIWAAISGSSGTVTCNVQDSPNNVAWTASVFSGITFSAPTTAYAIQSASVLLPPTVQRYVRVSASLSGTADGSITASLVF